MENNEPEVNLVQASAVLHMVGKQPPKVGKVSCERLYHFQCGKCEKWWTIADAPPRLHWFCPWCGYQQSIEETTK